MSNVSDAVSWPHVWIFSWKGRGLQLIFVLALRCLLFLVHCPRKKHTILIQKPSKYLHLNINRHLTTVGHRWMVLKKWRFVTTQRGESIFAVMLVENVNHLCLIYQVMFYVLYKQLQYYRYYLSLILLLLLLSYKVKRTVKFNQQK